MNEIKRSHLKLSQRAITPFAIKQLLRSIKLYSDVAIATMETIQSVFHLPGWQTEGFLECSWELS